MSPLIIALDVAHRQELERLLAALDPGVCRLKVGKELFTRLGPAVVESMHRRGFEVFLDLKFHDIPQTVAQAVRAAADLGVWMVNVHASGGRRMLEAAQEALVTSAHRPHLIAVTVLTSLEDADLQELGVRNSVQEQVMLLADLSLHCGLDGVVCSAQEATLLAQRHPQSLRVTPGIRPAASTQDDQRRTLTPSQALQAGATHLVIGRPITRATDPAAALAEILAQLAA